MKPNIGNIDRALRIIIGLGIIGYGIVTKSWIGAIGAIPLLTAFIGFCPLYCPLKISTRGKCCDNGKCDR